MHARGKNSAMHTAEEGVYSFFLITHEGHSQSQTGVLKVLISRVFAASMVVAKSPRMGSRISSWRPVKRSLPIHCSLKLR